MHGGELSRAVLIRMFYPYPAVDVIPDLGQPCEGELGHARLVHAEYDLHLCISGLAREMAVGRVARVAARRYGGEEAQDAGEPLLVDADAEDGSLLLVHVIEGICRHALLRKFGRTRCLLQLLVIRSVDPVKAHLFNRCALLDLTFQRQELAVARHEGKPLPHGVQCTVTVAEMGAQFAELEIAPRIVRLLARSLRGIAERLFQIAAVHEGDGVAIVPRPAPVRIRLGVRHPLYRSVVVGVQIDIVACVGIPQRNVAVTMRLLACEPPLDDAVLDVFVQIAEHFVEIARGSILHRLEFGDGLRREQGAFFCVGALRRGGVLLLLLAIKNVDGARRVPSEGVKHRPRQIRPLENGFCGDEDGVQIPREKVQIAVVRARCTAEEGHRVQTIGLLLDRLHERIAKIENLVGTLAHLVRQRIGDKARCDPVRMVDVHERRIAIHIGTEEGGQTRAACIDVEPQIRFVRCVRLALVGEIVVVKVLLCIVREGVPRRLECLRQIRQQGRRLLARRIEEIEIMDEADGGDLAECLIDDGGEHPPCAILVLPQERQELFAVECEGDPVAIGREPDGDIRHLDGVVVRAQGKAKRGGATDVDVPVLAHGGGGMAREIDERKELCAHALGGKDELIFLAALSELE